MNNSKIILGIAGGFLAGVAGHAALMEKKYHDFCKKYIDTGSDSMSPGLASSYGQIRKLCTPWIHTPHEYIELYLNGLENLNCQPKIDLVEHLAAVFQEDKDYIISLDPERFDPESCGKEDELQIDAVVNDMVDYIHAAYALSGKEAYSIEYSDVMNAVPGSKGNATPRVLADKIVGCYTNRYGDTDDISYEYSEVTGPGEVVVTRFDLCQLPKEADFFERELTGDENEQDS